MRRIGAGVLILSALGAVPGPALADAAAPRKVSALMCGGWRADYYPRFGCVSFYDVTDAGEPNYAMKDNLMFSVWLGYEIVTSANKEELEAITVNPVNGTVYVLTYDSGNGGGYDAQGNDGTGDWDLWRIDYQTLLKDFVDNARPMKTMYIPSIGSDGFDYETYGIEHPGGVYNTVYVSSGIAKIGELARNGDNSSGSNSGGGDYFEVDLDFVNPGKLVVLDDSDYPEDSFYADPENPTRAEQVLAAQSDHRIAALIRVSTDPSAATHDPNQALAREGGYNNGAAQSWETVDLGLVNMDGFTNDPNDAGYDPNYPTGYVATGFSEPIDMQFVTRSLEGGLFPDPPGGTETIEGVWIGENDTPASSGDDVDFDRIIAWDGGADDLAYRGGFRADEIADPNDNNGDLDWIRLDNQGGIIYGESGYYDAASGHYGEEGWGGHEPRLLTRSVLDYEYEKNGEEFVWLDPNDFTMYGPIPDSDPNDDDAAVCDGRFVAVDPADGEVLYLDIDGSPDFKPDLYVFDLAGGTLTTKEVDALGLTDGGADGSIYCEEHGIELFVRGDVNGDGVVDANDVTRLTALIADPTDGGKVPAEIGKEWYDLTGDGNLTSDDLTELVNIIGTATCTLTLSLRNGSWGSVDVSPNVPQYPAGTPVTLTAMPIDGKAFDTWRIFDPNFPGDANYAVLDSNNPLEVIMDANMEIQAKFDCGSGVDSVFLPVLAGLTLLGLVGKRRRTR